MSRLMRCEPLGFALGQRVLLTDSYKSMTLYR